MKWFLILLLCLPLLLMAGALVLNRVPLFDPPGALPRLGTYLTTHVAQTDPDPVYPELRTPALTMDLPAARNALITAMHGLGWHDVQVDDDVVRAVVRTPLLGFRDDVTVRLEPTEIGVLLHGRSASRVGKGDFGANARHLLQLFEALGAR